MGKLARWALLAILLVSPAAAEEDSKPIWLAVGPKNLLEPLAPLGEFREAEGFDVRYAAPPVAEALKDLGKAPAFLVVVGDYDREGSKESWQVEPMVRPFYKWRSPQRERFATDALFGDTDGDLVPDFPVGRIPARTPEQVKTLVAKTLSFERRESAMTDLRILAWAGSPGYGGVIDSMATGMLVSNVRKFGPAWSDRYLISSSPGNALCGWPPDQPNIFNREWKAGAVLAAFVAHANSQAVFAMRHGEKGIWYHLGHARVGLDEGPPVAPAVFLTCESGEFDGKKESMSEVMLFAPGGPPVVIAATTESHPLTNLFTGRGLLKRLGGEDPRVGRVWIDAQREAKGMRDFLMERMLKDVEGKLEDEIDIAKLKRDQVLMFEVFGDPAVKLKVPAAGPEPTIRKTETGYHYSVAKPAGAKRLVVGYRASTTPAAPKATPGGAKAANERLQKANAKERYQRVAAADADGEWSGDVTEAGWYRFVVVANGKLHVTTIELK